ncbi:phage replisome organizer N-terminal domain-containing protein [Clostridium paraputrificum]|uniref:phage replisome organizer N-terminal domain-containing protein n=1 Tax=Clostridium paraputrificum TaxID=29363 RepID=UPI003D33BF98
MEGMAWIKSMTNIYESESMRLLDVMPERDTIHYIYSRLKIQAGRTNDGGYIYYREGVAYTDEMLSTIFNRSVNSIRLALNTLENLGLVEVTEDKYIKIIDWEREQNVKAMDKAKEKNRERVAKHRLRKMEAESNEGEEVEEERATESCNGDVTITVMPCNADVMVQKKREEADKEVEEEVEIEKRERKKKEKELQGKLEIEKNNAATIAESGYKVLTYYEKITGRVGILNLSALNTAIGIYGEERVRLAIDRALEVDKPNMKYVNGILKNWAKEGYPKGEEGNGYRGNRKNKEPDKNKFSGFRAKEPARITEGERRKTEKKLI